MEKPSDSLCPIHKKRLKIVCTSPLCKKSRVCCTKCLYDSSHSECLTKTILIDDILENSYSERLQNWIISPQDREKLAQIKDLHIPNIKSRISLITQRLEDLQSALVAELSDFFKCLKEKVQENEVLKLFHSHLSLETLRNLLKTPSKTEPLHTFFSITPQEFLKVFENSEYNTLVSLEKDKILKLFDEKTLQLREQLPDFLHMKLQFPEFLPHKPLSQLLKSGNPIHKVIRFRKHGDSIWNFDRKLADFLTFEANKNVRIYGFGMYKNRTINNKWKVLGQILEGTDSTGKVLQKKDFVFANTLENQEIIGKLLFEPLDLKANTPITLYIWAVGPDTIAGSEGIAVAKNEKDGVEFRFFNTKTKEDNGTTVKAGQIPEIYYSLLD